MVPVPDGRIRLVPNINTIDIVNTYLSFARGANAVLDVDTYDLFAKPLKSSGASETAYQIQSPTIGQLQVRHTATDRRQPLLHWSVLWHAAPLLTRYNHHVSVVYDPALAGSLAGLGYASEYCYLLAYLSLYCFSTL